MNCSALSIFTVLVTLLCGTAILEGATPEPAPAIGPAAGTYFQPETITISDADSSATIYYTTDSSTPTASSLLYRSPIVVSSSMTIQAIAVSSKGVSSTVTSSAYRIQAWTTFITPAAGTYLSAQTVSILDRTAGATIYYTTDGSAPTPSSNVYTGPFTVSTNETVTAIAVAAGYDNSYPAMVNYVITPPTGTPVFSVGPGQYTSIQTISVSDPTPGASLYYTTNGSTPTTSSTPYTGPITVNTSETLAAIALASGDSLSPVASAAYTIRLPELTPTISPAAGTYYQAQSATIADADSSAVIYYTTNGSTPTTSSPVYTGPITVLSSTTVQAIAASSNTSVSSVASSAYSILAWTPFISPAPGTYTNAQTISISDRTSGATIYYTSDGSTPTAASTVYTGPFTVSTNETIKAIAIASGSANSNVASSTYVITQPATAPVFSLPAGQYTGSQTVAISDAAAGAALFYTTNGSTPTASSTPYTGPIAVSASETLQAVALLSKGSLSPVASATYTIIQSAATPTLSPAAGTYVGPRSVTITDATPTATIYYTTNGSAPTTGSNVYSGPLTVASNQTITAMAVAPNYTNSSAAAAAYIITAPAPAFSLAPGNYTGSQSIALSDSTANAAIYYTTNNSTPTTASSAYTGPIAVSVTETIQAIAVPNGGSPGPVAAATYTINSTVGLPTISPASGTFTSAQTVTIAEALSSATVYYTVNGSTPTSSSPVYTGPFTISTNSTIQAIAVANGDTSSAVATATYSFPAAAAVFSPPAGTYPTAQTVSLASTTPGAKIYYTTNGSTPTSGSNLYSVPITVSTNETVEAIVIATGYNNSSVASAGYAIAPASAAPTFYPVAGTYTKTETVTISSTTKGAVIYYTTDGSTPTANSALYSAPIAVSSNEVITAMALATSGSDSPVTSANYVIALPAALPTFSPGGSNTALTSIQFVTIADTTANSSIYYTTDGTTPTTASTLYTGPVTVAVSETIEAIALAPGGSSSAVGKASYKIALPTAAPVISPPSGTYNTTRVVTITDATPNAVIYYTVNGAYPTTSSPVYTGQAITATTNTTVQALAIAPNASLSPETSAVYTVVAPPPTITPASGTFDYNTVITMTDAAPGATIYYTTNGTTPTVYSPVYTGPISLAPSTTTTFNYQAVAIASSYLLSSVSEASVTVTLGSGVIANAVVGNTPLLTIPPDFLGLSTGYDTPAQDMGQASKGENQIYRNLVGNFTQYMSAPLLMRIEADNTQSSQIQPAIEPLAEFAQAVNVSYTLGVDQMHDDPTIAATEASDWLAGIPNNLIQAFEIGNEANAYPWQTLNGVPVRPMTYTFDDYLAEFQTWQQGIQTVTGSNIGYMGPSFSTSTWDADAESAILAGTDALSIVSQHAYCDGPPPGVPPPSDFMLQPINATKLPRGYAPFAAVAHQAGDLFRMGEINSISAGGVEGISDTYPTALWSMDIMFNYLANGMDGVNWHGGDGTIYSLYRFQQKPVKGKATYTLAFLNPLYYGLLAFAQVTGDGAQLMPVATMTDSNVSIWATLDNASTTHVVVINKDEAATGNIQITVPGYATGTVRYLTAPSITAKSGVTLGGQTFDGTPDGTIQGQLVTSTITGKSGVFTLPAMPVITAAIIDFSK